MKKLYNDENNVQSFCLQSVWSKKKVVSTVEDIYTVYKLCLKCVLLIPAGSKKKLIIPETSKILVTSRFIVSKKLRFLNFSQNLFTFLRIYLATKIL